MTIDEDTLCTLAARINIHDIIEYWQEISECQCHNVSHPIGSCLKCDMTEIKTSLEMVIPTHRIHDTNL
jgi:hypothetical protein